MHMLEMIELENYRCFEKTKMTLRELTIIVGKNNAGKSSLIEALRMISIASKKCINANFSLPPATLSLPVSVKGFKLPVERLKIDLRGVVYYYKQDIAKITATFSNKLKIKVYVNEEIAFATIISSDGNLVTTKSKSRLLSIEPISILPQIGLIKENEKKINEATVTEDLHTYLSSRHFRNEILLYEQYFKEFKTLAEETWSGLRVIDLVYNVYESDNISLLIEDARFPAEISLMGSGLQMWLQIIWFICKSKDSETIILDEPDVYMHPEMQLKILKLIKLMFKQVIIATHSVEIISNVPHAILYQSRKIVDKCFMQII